MKKLALLMAGVVILMGSVDLAEGIITDVEITPAEPTMVDLISILVSGEESGDIYIVDHDFQIDGAALSLDIYLERGFMPVVTPWSHSEDIGLLNIGTYDLEVNTFCESNPLLNDTFSTSFEVVPEPATILLFAIGMAGCIRRRNKS